MNTNISGNGVLIRKGTSAILPISDAQYIQYHNSNLTTTLPNTAGTVAVENVKDGLDALYKKITNASPMTEITYANLVTAKTNGTLNPGSWYRITDYATTTTQADTQSANHPFDVIVLATSTNTLSEEARAIQHSGDTYFANSNLNAWKIWYCLENDNVKYTWADTTNGKGVIYRMIDEWGNDCPYDFKNIQFKRQLDDEFVYDTNNGTDTWCYTFTAFVNGTEYDNSLGYTVSSNRVTVCYGNFIGQSDAVLSFNTFISYTSSINDQASRNYIRMSNNSIGEGSYNNVFHGTWYSNHINDVCIRNTFYYGSYYYNNFGHYFSDNNITTTMYDNTIGNWFHDNVINCVFYYNNIGDNCNNTRFGSYGQQYNFFNTTIGNHCYHCDLFGNITDCTFGTGVTYFKMATDTSYNKIIVESGVNYVNFSCAVSTGTDPCQNVKFCLGVGGTSTAPKAIVHPTAGDITLTEYKPANSQIITV